MSVLIEVLFQCLDEDFNNFCFFYYKYYERSRSFEWGHPHGGISSQYSRP